MLHPRVDEDEAHLHGLLHVAPDLTRVTGAVGRSDRVEGTDGVHSGVLGDDLVGSSGGEGRGDVVGASTSEDDDIEEGVGSETVGTVDRDTGDEAHEYGGR